MKFPGWENYEEDALRCRKKFNTLLKAIFRNYGVQHESEAYSGSFTNLHSRFQERRNRAEVEDVVVRCIKKLMKSFNDEFLTEFKGPSGAGETGDELSRRVKDIEVRIRQKASAWYVVTYRNKNAEFLSFPWTLNKFLTSIKQKRGDLLPSHISPIVHKMNRQMRVCGGGESNFQLPLLSPKNEEAFQEYRSVHILTNFQW